MLKATLKPVTEVKRKTTEVIAEVRATRRPVMITEHGRSAAVLVDVESYEKLVSRLEFLEGIARGERAFAEGRVVTQADARKRLERWLVKRK